MYRVYWTALVCVIAATLTALGIFATNAWKRAAPAPARDANYAMSQPTAVSGPSLGAQLRPRRLYPYSVIPGGVESAQELRNAVIHDPVVARHYADFDVSRARIIRLKQAREVYVSYRMGDHIFWTKKRLRLRKGETVITDGEHEARTRCGNRLSESPSEPVSSKEPSTKAMEAVPASEPLADVGPLPIFPFSISLTLTPPMSASPTNPTGGEIDDPPVYPIVGGGPRSDPPLPLPTSPVATPEPGTLLLLAEGLAAVSAASGLARSGKRRKTK
jgi:hypothetical protein